MREQKIYLETFAEPHTVIVNQYKHLWTYDNLLSYYTYRNVFTVLDQLLYVRLLLRKNSNVYNTSQIANNYYALTESASKKVWTDLQKEEAMQKIINSIDVMLKHQFLTKYEFSLDTAEMGLDTLKMSELSLIVKQMPDGVDILKSVYNKEALINWITVRLKRLSSQTYNELVRKLYNNLKASNNIQDKSSDNFILNQSVALFFKRIHLINSIISNNQKSYIGFKTNADSYHLTQIKQTVFTQNKNIELVKNTKRYSQNNFILFRTIEQLESYEKTIEKYHCLRDVNNINDMLMMSLESVSLLLAYIEKNNINNIATNIMNLMKELPVKINEQLDILSKSNKLNKAQKCIEHSINNFSLDDLLIPEEIYDVSTSVLLATPRPVSSKATKSKNKNSKQSQRQSLTEVNYTQIKAQFSICKTMIQRNSVILQFTPECQHAKCLCYICEHLFNYKLFDLELRFRLLIALSLLPIKANISGYNLYRSLLILHENYQSDTIIPFAAICSLELSYIEPLLAFQIASYILQTQEKYNVKFTNSLKSLKNTKSYGIYQGFVAFVANNDYAGFKDFLSTVNSHIKTEVLYFSQKSKLGSRTLIKSLVDGSLVLVEQFTLECILQQRKKSTPSKNFNIFHDEGYSVYEAVSLMLFSPCFNSCFHYKNNETCISDFQNYPLYFNDLWFFEREEAILNFLNGYNELSIVEKFHYIMLLSAFLYEVRLLSCNWRTFFSEKQPFDIADLFKKQINNYFEQCLTNDGINRKNFAQDIVNNSSSSHIESSSSFALEKIHVPHAPESHTRTSSNIATPVRKMSKSESTVQTQSANKVSASILIKQTRSEETESEKDDDDSILDNFLLTSQMVADKISRIQTPICRISNDIFKNTPIRTGRQETSKLLVPEVDLPSLSLNNEFNACEPTSKHITSSSTPKSSIVTETLTTPINQLRRTPIKINDNTDLASLKLVSRQSIYINPLLNYRRTIQLKQVKDQIENQYDAEIEHIVAGICYGFGLAWIFLGLPDEVQLTVLYYMLRNWFFWNSGFPDLTCITLPEWLNVAEHSNYELSDEYLKFVNRTLDVNLAEHQHNKYFSVEASILNCTSKTILFFLSNVNVNNSETRFYEVKSTTDKLSPKQKLWISSLSSKEEIATVVKLKEELVKIKVNKSKY